MAFMFLFSIIFLYCKIDFEASCEQSSTTNQQNPRKWISEIIEFPAIAGMSNYYK